ncbi:hypothetical protein F5I97DRAFT_1526133 [Phlebopus sp. FC_14]|nr:hypothetical protein F5I97DRAFT_1526133 [Phlebopus sp. FC_14]
MARTQTSASANKPHLPSKQVPHNPHISSHRTRHRSYSDPFSDPIYPPKPVPRLPPDPPPKYPPYPKVTTAGKSTFHRDNMADAVRDTVQLRSSDHPSRTRTGKSHTSTTSPNATRPQHSRRSHSQDSVLHAANALEKAKGKPRGKKGSMHADVIDRLDFSGVGPMFHHDGPFDACAPSRNRHRTKAPMLAWSAASGGEELVLSSSDAPYPSPDVLKGSFALAYEPPKKKVDAIAEAWGIHEPEPYEEFFAGGGTTRRDGETPSNSIYAGREGHGSRNGTPQHSIGKRSKDGRDLREVYKEYLDEDMKQLQSRDKERVDREHRRPKRGALPPPQPIMVPEASLADADGAQISPSGAPRRTKSLMQRIRKMRDSPNVPVGHDEGIDPPSPTSGERFQPVSRPTHRPQNSFLGRFAGGNGVQSERRGNAKENTSPLSDTSEAYVYIEDPRKEKQLPATPRALGTARTPSGEDKHAYFDGTPGSPGSGGGLGRKTSLLKKVKDVVRGPR